MLKSAIDFSQLNIEEGWELAPGAGPGIEMKMLSGKLDEDNKIGVRTRLIGSNLAHLILKCLFMITGKKCI